jgi:hypothetical protein
MPEIAATPTFRTMPHRVPFAWVILGVTFIVLFAGAGIRETLAS